MQLIQNTASASLSQTLKADMTKLQATILHFIILIIHECKHDIDQSRHRQHHHGHNSGSGARCDDGGGRHHRRPHLHRYSRRPLCIPASTWSSTGDNTEQKLEPQNLRQVFNLFTNHINNKRGKHISCEVLKGSHKRILDLEPTLICD